MASADLKDELTCPICLNLYTDPVTLKCGHNFCQECIEKYLDTPKESAAYRCPQCRAQFHDRPVLQRNTTLRNIAEHFLAREEQEEREAFCTYCVNAPVVASKTCLWCEASLCDIHLKVHNKSPEHVLIQPTKSFRNRKCSLHKKVLMYYCSEDEECLCVSCCLGEKHRGHQVELLNEAFKKKHEKLRIIHDRILQQREEIVKRVQGLQDHLSHIPEKATGIVERVEIHYRELKMKQDNLEKHILNEISKQQKQVSLSVSDLIQQLELKKDQLSRKLSTIEELRQMTDPLLYLQQDTDDFADVLVDGDWTIQETSTTDLNEDAIVEILNSEMKNMMLCLPKGFYVQEASGILLDVNTASNDLQISDDLKTASWSAVNQGRPENPLRFEYYRALSLKSFSEGRLYWDVEVSKEGTWRVGVTYPSIGRRGPYSLIGNNKKSWGLRRYRNGYSVRHNEKETPLSCHPTCCKVRIYLDYTAGQLSFYELGNSMKHLHTFSATFTEKVYPVFVVCDNGWVRVLH